MTNEGELPEIVQDVLDMFPGATRIANLLRSVAWLIIGLCVLGGALAGYESDGAGRATYWAVLGGGAGVLYATGAFALAYILLLLNEIEQNTRVTASGNTLAE